MLGAALGEARGAPLPLHEQPPLHGIRAHKAMIC